MNELEHEIAKLDRPEPSPQLDERIEWLFQAPLRPSNRHRDTITATVVTAAAVLALMVSIQKRPVTESRSIVEVPKLNPIEPKHPLLSAPAPVVIHVPEIAAMFMPAPTQARLWGSGELRLSVIGAEAVDSRM